ncbi:MAG TPA: cysteine desulfurase [Vicinamibacterales bacterium]|nr:cysteine desulfurase [Vicinamibacterales bacterium]
MEHPAREGRGGIGARRRDFPLLDERFHGKPLVYLDSAATTQKPRAVIGRLSRFYQDENANVQRGVYALSERATDAYESARATVQRFINAALPREIVFVRGTTEAINLVAAAWSAAHLRAGDEIVVSEMEQNSNIVPWQMACEATGAALRVIPIDDRGDLRLDAFELLLTDRTRLVSIAHVSNALGTVNPVREIVQRAHAHGIPVLVDGAQAVAHGCVDVRELGCDFYAFSGHKVFAPTGIGVLYGRAAILDALPPYQAGGGMIRSVTFDRTQYADVPARFEAGTPDIGGAVALGCAIDYLNAIGVDEVASYERDLLDYATAALSEVPGVRIIGAPARRAAILSFVVEGVHAHDVGTVLDREGVAVRAGHHCCQPLMARLGLAATVRASLALYNTRADVDALVAAVVRAREVFA